MTLGTNRLKNINKRELHKQIIGLAHCLGDRCEAISCNIWL